MRNIRKSMERKTEQLIQKASGWNPFTELEDLSEVEEEIYGKAESDCDQCDGQIHNRAK